MKRQANNKKKPNVEAKASRTTPRKISRSSTKTRCSLSSLATLGKLGYFPKGSGTIGSLVALPIVYLTAKTSISLLWITTILLFIFGLLAIQKFTANKPEKDPGCVIVDEVVGQLLTFFVVAPNFLHWPFLFIGFILFRLFDIFKFGPVAFWDRRKTPMGVMMDDVTAGIFAGFILSMLQVIMLETLHIK